MASGSVRAGAHGALPSPFPSPVLPLRTPAWPAIPRGPWPGWGQSSPGRERTQRRGTHRRSFRQGRALRAEAGAGLPTDAGRSPAACGTPPPWAAAQRPGTGGVPLRVFCAAMRMPFLRSNFRSSEPLQQLYWVLCL